MRAYVTRTDRAKRASPLVMGVSTRRPARGLGGFPRTRNGCRTGAVFHCVHCPYTGSPLMTEYVVGVIVAVALVGYLALAVTYPERF
ncbi:potassium-transporting ATPase subunit F [Streptomyces sp. TRM64462]|uniref:potassium-transporting ATPase subunit F n=1 Tax=Streptomyces sp. TRM64462 TaxID=2741726 RepID=UPI001C30F161|nr:potassium-transporting ATPase subunit F [Streptomyces sp. TRM64462]